MSNVLTTGTINAAGMLAQTEQLPRHMVALLAIGLCVLSVWIVRRSLYPQKLSLIGSPGRPNSLNVIIAYVVLVSYIAIVHVLVWLIGDVANGKIIANIGGQVACLALSLTVAWSTFKGRIRRGLGLTLRHWRIDSIRGVVAYLAVLPVCIGLLFLTQWIAVQICGPMEFKTHPLLQDAKNTAMAVKVMAVVSAVVLAPLAEEVLFRGLLQSMVRKYTGKPWIAIASITLIFVLVHWPMWYTFPSLAALSIVLGYNYERTGRLTAPIITHMLFNLVFILTTMMQTG